MVYQIASTDDMHTPGHTLYQAKTDLLITSLTIDCNHFIACLT